MDIKGYVLGIFGICVASAVARVICAGEATKKHIEMLTSLCLIATVASPLASFIGDADGISGIFDFKADTPALDYGALYEEYLLYGNAETSEMILEGELASGRSSFSILSRSFCLLSAAMMFRSRFQALC